MKTKHIIIPVLLSLVLGACGELSPTKSGEPVKPTELGKTKKSGGYYLDDGPGDNPPANIDAIPDAVPRIEPLLARANKPDSFHACFLSFRAARDCAPQATAAGRAVAAGSP